MSRSFTSIKRKSVMGILALGLLCLLPVILKTMSGGVFLTRMAIIGLLYVASAVAWDLMGGLVGQVSFGHATFFGIGAYVTAIMVRAGTPGVWTLVPASLFAGTYAAFWGWPCLRLRGPFFAIATIGVGEATRLIALNWESVSGGATGLTLPIGGGSEEIPYYLALVLAFLALYVAFQIRKSKLGLGLSCIREDVVAAESIGISSALLQLEALVISATIVGAAGGIYALYLYYVAPSDVFSFNRSIGFILMSIIGGLNTLWGPAIGALLFLILERFLEISFPALHLGIYGLMLIFIVLYEPRGLWALLSSHAKERSRDES